MFGIPIGIARQAGVAGGSSSASTAARSGTFLSWNSSQVFAANAMTMTGRDLHEARRRSRQGCRPGRLRCGKDRLEKFGDVNTDIHLNPGAGIVSGGIAYPYRSECASGEAQMLSPQTYRATLRRSAARVGFVPAPGAVGGAAYGPPWCAVPTTRYCLRAATVGGADYGPARPAPAGSTGAVAATVAEPSTVSPSYSTTA
jgi:hypothetical protein